MPYKRLAEEIGMFWVCLFFLTAALTAAGCCQYMLQCFLRFQFYIFGWSTHSEGLSNVFMSVFTWKIMHNNAKLSVHSFSATYHGQGHGGSPATSSSSSVGIQAVLSQLRHIISLVCPPRGLLLGGHPQNPSSRRHPRSILAWEPQLTHFDVEEQQLWVPHKWLSLVVILEEIRLDSAIIIIITTLAVLYPAA